MYPKVSIIIPVYKVEKYLEDTVDAFLSQTYRNLEIILVDDGSPDNCGVICDSYARIDSRIKVIHQCNAGLGSARNAGLKICTGEYITFCDSDDIVSEDYLEYLLDLSLNYGANISICQISDFQDGDQPHYEIGLNYPSKSLSNYEALEEFFYMRKIRTSVNIKLFARNLIQYLHFPEGIYYEDAKPMYFTLLNASKVAVGDAHKYGYRHHSSSITHEAFSLKEMPYITEWEDIYKDVLYHCPYLKTAVTNRMLSAYAHVFLKIHPKEYEDIQNYCWKNIKKYRKSVLFDIHARKKAWWFSLLSLSGEKFTYIFGKYLIYKGE